MFANLYELTLAAVVVVAILGVFVVFKRRKAVAELAPVFAMQRSVNALSPEAAREEMERRLRESGEWTTVPASEAVSKFHPTLNQFFSTHRAVLRKDEEWGIDLTWITRPTFEGYLRVGDVFAADVHTLFDPETGETVVFIEGERPSQALRFPTIHHYVLFEMRSFADD